MTDIPDDIMKSAEDALDKMLCNCRESCGGTQEGLRAASIADIAEAIMAERERSRQLLSEADSREKEARAKALEEAAKVAEGKARDFNFQQALADYDDLAVGENGVRIEIADNIRALQSEERGW